MEVIEVLYASYRHEFFQWASRRFQVTEQDFEDAWQESVLAFFEQVRSRKITMLRCSVRTWLFAVGYKRLLTYGRKKKRIFWKDAVDEALVANAGLFDFQWDTSVPDEWELVEQAIQTLSPQCREVLVQRFYEGKKIPAIMAALGHNSENTTSATLSRCLKKLKEMALGMMNEKL